MPLLTRVQTENDAASVRVAVRAAKAAHAQNAANALGGARGALDTAGQQADAAKRAADAALKADAANIAALGSTGLVSLAVRSGRYKTTKDQFGALGTEPLTPGLMMTKNFLLTLNSVSGLDVAKYVDGLGAVGTLLDFGNNVMSVISILNREVSTARALSMRGRVALVLSTAVSPRAHRRPLSRCRQSSSTCGARWASPARTLAT